MKIKLLILGILSALMCLCFVGCQGRVDTKSELNQYLHSNGYKSCSIEEGPVETGHGDFYWNVYDKTNEIHFTVYQELTEDLYGSVEVFDNYNAKLVEKHIDDFPDHEGVEIYTEAKWDTDPILRFEFANVEDLEKKCKVVEKCAEYIDTLEKDIHIAVSAKYNSPRVEFFKDNSLDDIMGNLDYGYGLTYEEIENGELLKMIKDKYFSWGYKYRFQEIESEMTEEDIKNFGDDSFNSCIAVYHSGDEDAPNNKDFKVYDDIYGGGYITYGNMYYLLIEEGFDVEGTTDDFTVTNIDGQSCRFSYSFVDDSKYKTYYLVDGEVVQCSVKYFMLNTVEFKDLFGLSIKSAAEVSNTNK